MKIKTTISSAIMLAMCLTTSAQQEKTLWNFDWQFSRDSLNWTAVNLPHDYQIEQPWIEPAADEKASDDPAANFKSVLSARAFKELGKGYYKKTFTPTEEMKGKRIVLDFEGIMLVGDVYLNGERIGGTDYGYVGFEIDITKQLNWNKENTVTVVADTQGPKNSRWYTGGGLFRDVNLIVSPAETFFTRHALYIQPTILQDGSASVKLQVEATCTKGGKQRPANLFFDAMIKDAEGNVIATNSTTKKFYPAQKTNEYQLDSILLNSPKLWNLDAPHLYTAEVVLKDEAGNILDKVSDQFGVRTIEYGPEFGFKLNGQKVLLKGIANHHTLGALGAAAYERAIEKRIKLLKEFGVNHIRTSHNPYSESLLRLCDKYGILVVDELYDKWTKQYVGGRKSWAEQWQKDVPEWVKRDRNHPCVVMWSLGNELQQMWTELDFADWGVTPYRLQKELLKRYDQNRPVTVAMHPRYRNVDTDSLPAPLVMETDIAAYNYRYMYFPGDAAKFPWMKFYQSEANTQNLGRNFFEMDLDKVVGLAYWGAIDYLGESQGWPRKGWHLGMFDISLEPKGTAYFMKSFFKEDEPMVYVGVYQGKAPGGNWNGVNLGSINLTEEWAPGSQSTPSSQSSQSSPSTPNSPKTIYAFSNCDEVELLLNGKSLGAKKNERTDPTKRNKFVWEGIEYKPGKLEAVGKNGGKIVSRDALETAGKPAALKVSADNPEWKADGLDLQHVRIHAIDKKGRRIYSENQKLTFTVEGDAEIVAVSNGDQTSNEGNVALDPEKHTAERSLWNGSALVILRAGKSGGKVSLKISGTEKWAQKTVSFDFIK